MYGLTDKPITDLVPLARMWKNPPKIENVKGCSSEGYKMEERAYHLTAKKETLAFSVATEDKSPLVNPCFVIKNWNSQQQASLRINAEEVGIIV